MFLTCLARALSRKDASAHARSPTIHVVLCLHAWIPNGLRYRCGDHLPFVLIGLSFQMSRGTGGLYPVRALVARYRAEGCGECCRARRDAFSGYFTLGLGAGAAGDLSFDPNDGEGFTCWAHAVLVVVCQLPSHFHMPVHLHLAVRRTIPRRSPRGTQHARRSERVNSPASWVGGRCNRFDTRPRATPIVICTVWFLRTEAGDLFTLHRHSTRPALRPWNAMYEGPDSAAYV